VLDRERVNDRMRSGGSSLENIPGAAEVILRRGPSPRWEPASMSSTRCAFVIMWLILAGLLTVSPGRGYAFEGGGRTFELRRDLGTVRPRVEREPRASAYALSDVERRLHDRRIDAPRDPRLAELEIEARRLRWQADRNARRSGAADRLRDSALATGRRSRSRAISALPTRRSAQRRPPPTSAGA
jgi:hypothetical protein